MEYQELLAEAVPSYVRLSVDPTSPRIPLESGDAVRESVSPVSVSDSPNHPRKPAFDSGDELEDDDDDEIERNGEVDDSQRLGMFASLLLRRNNNNPDNESKTDTEEPEETEETAAETQVTVAETKAAIDRVKANLPNQRFDNIDAFRKYMKEQVPGLFATVDRTRNAPAVRLRKLLGPLGTCKIWNADYMFDFFRPVGRTQLFNDGTAGLGLQQFFELLLYGVRCDCCFFVLPSLTMTQLSG